MTRDWRKVEGELAAALAAAGVEMSRQGGDLYVVAASFFCPRMAAGCHAGIGPYGRVECADCNYYERHSINPSLSTIDITALARRIADET